MGDQKQYHFSVITVLCLFLLLISSNQAKSQLKKTLTPECEFVIVPDSFDINAAFKEFEKGEVIIHKSVAPNMGLSTGSSIWTKFTIENHSDTSMEKILELAFPRFDTVRLYRKKISGFEYLGVSGDGISFSKRKEPFRNIVFTIKIPKKSKHTFYLKASKTGDIGFPLFLWEPSAFYDKENKENVYYGVFFGILAFTIVISLVLLLTFRSRLYVFYALYITFFSLFASTNFGFTHQLLWPSNSYFSNQLFLIYSQFTVIFLLLFSDEFLQVKHFLSRQARLLLIKVPVYLLTILGVYYLLFNNTSIYEKTYSILAPINFLIYIFSFLALASISFYLKNKFKPNAILFMVSYSFVLTSYIMHTLRIINILPYNFFTANITLIGSFTEVTLLTISIGYIIKKGYDEKSVLLEKVNFTQQKLISAIISGQEMERNRIGRELHDGVGTQLSGLKMLLENQLDQENIVFFDKIIKDVRGITHSLVSPELKKNGLISEVNNLVKKFNIQSKINLEFIYFNWPKETLGQEIELHLYRIIQEALANTMKHSNATSASLQCIGKTDELNILIEDNGVGVEAHDEESGVGLLSIKSRVTSMGGSVVIDSTKGHGFHLIISIPFISLK